MYGFRYGWWDRPSSGGSLDKFLFPYHPAFPLCLLSQQLNVSIITSAHKMQSRLVPLFFPTYCSTRTQQMTYIQVFIFTLFSVIGVGNDISH